MFLVTPDRKYFKTSLDKMQGEKYAIGNKCILAAGDRRGDPPPLQPRPFLTLIPRMIYLLRKLFAQGKSVLSPSVAFPPIIKFKPCQHTWLISSMPSYISLTLQMHNYFKTEWMLSNKSDQMLPIFTSTSPQEVFPQGCCLRARDWTWGLVLAAGEVSIC